MFYHIQVSVRTVDAVQGLEFRTLIISTVRTCSLLGDNEEDAGFLSNPKVYGITMYDMFNNTVYVMC